MNLPGADTWKRLNPLLDDLLDLDDEAQQRRLAELRVRDAGLAGELERLLTAARRAEASYFLDGNAYGGQAGPALLFGKQVGAYVIEAALGEGSTGSVWRARRADGRFEGSVAVKLLHMSLIGRAGALRFEREGVILARLVHPNIARLLDAGVTAEGQPYLVLELVEGQRIDRHCDALHLDVERRLTLFDDVLAAVAHAHSHLVIHRDIKPNNILVDSEGTVKLLDFGIAKLLAEEAEASSLTVDGRSVLTPAYAAPEQLQGGPITTATDVYALGVLLYQLLTGRHPTAAADTASSAELIRATLDTDPVRLTDALTGTGSETVEDLSQAAADRGTPLPRLRRQLEGDLENIVARALRKSPAERYQTVAALADDLQRHLAHEPVSARPDSMAYRTAKFVRRNRGMVSAAALVLLAVVAGLVGTITQAYRAEVESRRAQHERDNALRQLGYAKSTNEFMTFLLQEGADKPFTTAELLARAEPVLETQFAGDPAQRAHLLSELAALHAGASNFKKALALLLRAQAAARGIPDVPLQAGIECLLAFMHGNADDFDLAARTFDSAFARLRTIPDVDRALLGSCLQIRGDVAGMRGDSKAALTDLRAALDTLGTPRPEDRSLAIQMRNSLGIALNESGQTAVGVAELQRAIAELDALGRGRSQGASLMYQNVGAVLAWAGQPLASIEAHARGWDIARGLGWASPRLELNYALNLIELGRAREAMPLIEHAAAEGRARGDRRIAATALVEGAPAWCLTADLPRCAEMLAAGRSELTSLVPSGHSLFGVVDVSSARLAMEHGEFSEARDRLRRAVPLFDASPRKNRRGLRALTLLARVEVQLGDLDAAQSHATQAVAQARATLGGFEHSEWLGSALVAEGMVQKARDRPAAARASWEAALTELQAVMGDAAPATAEVRQLLAGS